MQFFKMMVGLPGSGKSTAARGRAVQGSEILRVVSTDDIREKLTGDASDQTINNKVFAEAKREIVDALNTGTHFVIFDATNVVAKRRISFLEEIKKAIEKDHIVHYTAEVMCTPIEVCLERNKKRAENGGRFVPEDVIYRMLRQFQIPQYFEGFDIIDFNAGCADIPGGSILREDNEYTLHSLSKRFGYGFDQKTPYHKHDLFTHCEKVAEQFTGADIRHFAGIVHDIGKAFTQHIDENGIAHYYNHENVGAYKLLGYLDYFIHPTNKCALSIDDVLEILFYVNYHMHIRDIIKSEKAVDKYRRLWGQERFTKLVEFMEADNKASGRNVDE